MIPQTMLVVVGDTRLVVQMSLLCDNLGIKSASSAMLGLKKKN